MDTNRMFGRFRTSCAATGSEKDIITVISRKPLIGVNWNERMVMVVLSQSLDGTDGA